MFGDDAGCDYAVEIFTMWLTTSFEVVVAVDKIEKQSCFGTGKFDTLMFTLYIPMCSQEEM
eukprot:CAMPEP_0168536032 /NCGR_PEP_ID=MMETSP0405-20121227/19225_1 /TAXON_ID=498012 /ORGANISM="Trichosphaerium sp, Strain Am-I-7 wt" /LENGTH=60 /DNA_ID=CAMNT_0008563795 /DNA_START=849 /DNA_END=1028 /DNA_ORIENTATION=-